MRAVLVVIAAGSAGACGYRSGSFTGPTGSFPGEHVTVGCLDVAVAPYHDAAAAGPVIAYEFGNRCDRPARVDLTAVVVRGRTLSGEEVALAPYDPAGTMRAARLEARRIGREVIEYEASEPLALICADVGALDGGHGGSREVCLDAGGAP